MQRSLVASLVAAATLLLAASASAAGNLLVNGSFEQGIDPGTFIDLPGGSTAITGWIVGDLHVDYCSSLTWNASDGVRSVDLDGSAGGAMNGSIRQSFPTTAGQHYRVDFDLSGNSNAQPQVKQVEVSAGNSVQVYTHDCGAIFQHTIPFAIVYEHETLLFTATSSTTTLQFRSLTPLSGFPTGWGAVIDNVVVDLAAWTDLGFALAGVAGEPQLVGTGTLAAGSAGSLVLSHAASSAPALLFIALSNSPTPFKGGTLVPVPALATLPLSTSAAGGITLPWASWPAGLSGASLYYQYGVKDAAAVKGVSLSHALRGDVP